MTAALHHRGNAPSLEDYVRLLSIRHSLSAKSVAYSIQGQRDNAKYIALASRQLTAWRLAMTTTRSRIRRIGYIAMAAAFVIWPNVSRADESGVSFWLPGLYGSLAAVPTTPGWSVATIYYHTSVNATGAAAASREFQVGRFSPNVNINLNIALSAQADLALIAPTYTFATPVLGGQLSATLAGVSYRGKLVTAGIGKAAYRGGA